MKANHVSSSHGFHYYFLENTLCSYICIINIYFYLVYNIVYTLSTLRYDIMDYDKDV